MGPKIYSFYLEKKSKFLLLFTAMQVTLILSFSSASYVDVIIFNILDSTYIEVFWKKYSTVQLDI
jgi:hypothetical protein